MRNIIVIIAVAVMSVTMAQAAMQADKKSNTETVTFDVNLNCNKCKAKLEKHIPFEKGVKDMEVDVAGKKVTVTFDTRKNTAEEIGKAIVKLGYTVTVSAKE